MASAGVGYRMRSEYADMTALSTKLGPQKHTNTRVCYESVAGREGQDYELIMRLKRKC